MLVSHFTFMVGNSFWHHRAGREGLGEDADRTARELMGNRLVSGQMFSKQRFFTGGNVATDLATIHATMLNGCCCNRIL